MIEIKLLKYYDVIEENNQLKIYFVNMKLCLRTFVDLIWTEVFISKSFVDFRMNFDLDLRHITINLILEHLSHGKV